MQAELLIATFAAIAVAISGNYSPRQQTKSNTADLLLINGNIITVDANDSIAQALAIRGGKIIAVGSNDDIHARFSKASRVIDLRGRTALPG